MTALEVALILNAFVIFMLTRWLYVASRDRDRAIEQRDIIERQLEDVVLELVQLREEQS